MAYYECECDNFDMTEGKDTFEMNEGIPGPGVPAGGSAGQVLRKTTSADYDTEWDTLTASDVAYGADTVSDALEELDMITSTQHESILSLQDGKAERTEIATYEPGGTALHAHAEGEMLYVGETLYIAKTDISAGDSIVTTGSGANVIETSVGDEFSKTASDIGVLRNTLNDDIDDLNYKLTLVISNYGDAKNEDLDRDNITITRDGTVNVINGIPHANIGLEIARFTAVRSEALTVTGFDSAHSTAFCYITDLNNNTRVATCYGGNTEAFNVIAGHVYVCNIYIPGYTIYTNYTLAISIPTKARGTALEYFPETITASNYNSYLPDVDKALPFVKYRISSRGIPAHLPPVLHNPLNCLLESFGSPSDGGIQYIKDLGEETVLWFRGGTSVWESVNHRITVGKGSGPWDFDKLYDALLFAYSNPNTVIEVYDGTYDLIEEMGANLTSGSIGILLGKNTVINFRPHAYVICNYTGSDSQIMGLFSPFYSGMGDYEINNMKLSCSNVRYCVHDEKSDGADAYSHKYNNCTFYLDNSANQYGYPQCIGGGLGKNGHIEIVGCSFESETVSEAGWKEEVSYHNSSASGAKSEVIVKDNFFTNGTFRFSYYGASTEITNAFVSNNSVKFAPFVTQESPSYTIQNVALHEWNNPIRS